MYTVSASSLTSECWGGGWVLSTPCGVKTWSWDSEHLVHVVDQQSEPPQQHQAGIVWGPQESHYTRCDKECHRTLCVRSQEPSECQPKWPTHPGCPLWVSSVPMRSRLPTQIHPARGQAIPIPVRPRHMDSHSRTLRLAVTSCFRQVQAAPP